MTEWASFYLTCAQVGVTAFALMFAAYQFNRAVWIDRPLGPITAAESLFELLAVALVGLGLGTPIRWIGIAVMVAACAFGLVLAGWYVICYGHAVKQGITNEEQTRGRFRGIPLLSYGAILVSAGVMGFDPATRWPLWVTAAACIWLIFSGCSETFLTLSPRVFSRPEGDPGKVIVPADTPSETDT